jgi:hypothetical protein
MFSTSPELTQLLRRGANECAFASEIAATLTALSLWSGSETNAVENRSQ